MPDNVDKLFLAGIILAIISGASVLINSLIQIYPELFLKKTVLYGWTMLTGVFPGILIILGSLVAYYRTKIFGGVIIVICSVLSLMITSNWLFFPSFFGIIGTILILIPKEKQK